MNEQEKLIGECEDCYEQLIISSVRPMDENTKEFVRSKIKSCRFAPSECTIIREIAGYEKYFHNCPQ